MYNVYYNIYLGIGFLTKYSVLMSWSILSSLSMIIMITMLNINFVHRFNDEIIIHIIWSVDCVINSLSIYLYFVFGGWIYDALCGLCHNIAYKLINKYIITINHFEQKDSIDNTSPSLHNIALTTTTNIDSTNIRSDDDILHDLHATKKSNNKNGCDELQTFSGTVSINIMNDEFIIDDHIDDIPKWMDGEIEFDPNILVNPEIHYLSASQASNSGIFIHDTLYIVTFISYLIIFGIYIEYNSNSIIIIIK